MRLMITFRTVAIATYPTDILKGNIPIGVVKLAI